MENARLQKALADAKQTEDRLRGQRDECVKKTQTQKQYIERLLWDIQQLQEELASVRENFVKERMRKIKPTVQTSEAGTQTLSTPALSTPAFFHHHHNHGRKRKRERDTDF